jgi:hypothetical protein
MGIIVVTIATALHFSMSGQQLAKLASVAYGQSSLEELESQLKQENTLEDRMATYRAALTDYIKNNNITGYEDLNETSIDTLEKIVESHMDEVR